MESKVLNRSGFQTTQNSEVKNFTHAIALHDHYAHMTELEECLGDGFLYAKSPLFRNVRNYLKKNNYTFVSQLSPEGRDFFMSSVFQLEKILFQKKLFPRQNAPSFKSLIPRYGHLPFQLVDLTLPEAQGLLFHESVHCIIADDFGWKSLLLKDQKDPVHFLKELFTAEATALSFEYLLCASFEDPIERSLVTINALGAQLAECLSSLRMLQRIISHSEAALWIFRGYFASNYFYESSNSPNGLFTTIYNLCLNQNEKIPQAMPYMQGAFEAGFALSKGFRYATANIFFKSIGIEGDLKNASPFDLYEVLRTDNWPCQYFLNIYNTYSQDKPTPDSRIS